MSIIVCKIPVAGLGNQLFPLMKAVVKQQLTGIPLVVTNYRQLVLGPYLRREKSKRRYTGYFKFEKSLFSAWVDAAKLRFYRRYLILNEPPLEKTTENLAAKYMYVYKELPHWSDYFFELRDYRDIVVASFNTILAPQILQIADTKQAPCIGVHIRMGDFRKLETGEDFEKSGTVRTPEEYFIRMITAVREIAGKNLPVTVFTDGYRQEFNELFDLPAVTMMEGNADIVDLIVLSRSRIIITSATSTFSYWAGFLSEAVLIMHPDHIHQPIRKAEFNRTWFEGALVTGKPDDLLVKNIKEIDFEKNL